ncbi:MAG: hypothetical protein JW819_08505 [Candidatus Krumholzibacteriota bacterium]|nr:hypothetical protein [Candidatus Krumholzibacteriota bacterium]
MRESVRRSFFTLAYEHLGTLALFGFLRALPWLLFVLVLTFLPPDLLPRAAWLGLLAGLALLALAAGPWLTGGVYHLATRLARGESPAWRDARPGFGRRYGVLLAWELLQALLALVLAHNLLLALRGPVPDPGFGDRLALAAGVWIWISIRAWGFSFLPLLAGRGLDLRETARETLLLILGEPRHALGQFAVRQMLLLLLVLSGVGIVAGLGSLPALHACLGVRAALRRRGLDLVPPGQAPPTGGLPRDEGWRGFWRPWE